MDRRKFLKRFSTLAMFSFVTPVSAQLPDVPVVLRKRLAPDAAEVVFSGPDLMQDAGLFQLISRGNALWIHKVEWEDNWGTRHSQTVRRNLPPGKAMKLPRMYHAQKLIFSITCLPLANAETEVDLVVGFSGHRNVSDS